MTEGQIQKAITDLLKAEGVLFFRMNSGAFAGSYKGKSRFVRFGVAGMADLLVTVPATEARTQRVWWLEIKVERGQQSVAQKNFQSYVESMGHFYTICRDVEEVLVFLRFLRSQ